MPDHVLLNLAAGSESELRSATGEALRRSCRGINFREGWRGYLCHGHSASYPMNELYLLATVRYVELNPVRAELVESGGAYPWSSAAAHWTGWDDEK